jgi:hypothetical protein
MQAGRFVARLLRDEAAYQRVGFTTPLRVAACKADGVSVEQSVLDDLSRLTREKRRLATLSRLSAREVTTLTCSGRTGRRWSSTWRGTSGWQFAEDSRAAQPS